PSESEGTYPRPTLPGGDPGSIENTKPRPDRRANDRYALRSGRRRETGEEQRAVDAEHRGEVGVGDVDHAADEVVAAVADFFEPLRDVLRGGPGGDGERAARVEDVVDAADDVEVLE